MNGRTISNPCIGLCNTSKSPLSPDFKALLSEFDIFETSVRGSCGADPGPERLRIATLSAWPVWCKEETSACRVLDIPPRLQCCVLQL